MKINGEKSDDVRILNSTNRLITVNVAIVIHIANILSLVFKDLGKFLSATTHPQHCDIYFPNLDARTKYTSSHCVYSKEAKENLISRLINQ